MSTLLSGLGRGLGEAWAEAWARPGVMAVVILVGLGWWRGQE